MSKFKRFLSLALALLMVFSMMPQLTLGASAAESDTRTVYFTNNNSWTGTIYAYAWTTANSSTTNYLGEWPGTAMTYVETNNQNQDIYKISVSTSAVNIIFNNSSDKTADLTISNETDGYYNGGTYTYSPTVYYVAGDAGLCGENWNTSADPMTYNNGIREITFENVAAGTYGFKIVANSDWNPQWPTSNYNLTVAKDNSKVTITFDVSTQTITAEAEHVHDYEYECSTECKYCDVGEREASHKYVDGVCTYCSGDCDHAWKDGICSECSAVCSHNYVDGTCSDCGYTDSNFGTCDHTYNGNGVCENCGVSCEHTYEGDSPICTAGCGMLDTSKVPAAFNAENTGYADIYEFFCNENAAEHKVTAGFNSDYFTAETSGLGWEVEESRWTWNVTVNVKGYVEYLISQEDSVLADHTLGEDIPESETLTFVWNSDKAQWVRLDADTLISYYVHCPETGSDDEPTSVEVATLAELQKALADTSNDLPIVVTKTIVIPAGETVKLDLYGKTVSMVETGTISANHTMIDNRGTLMITDSSEEGTGKLSYKFDGTASKQWAYAVTTISNNQGSLTIAGGTIESESLSTNSAGDSTYVYKFTVDNLTNGGQGDAKLVVTGGTITAAKGGSIRGFANSTSCTNTIEIKGGVMNGQVWMQDANANANKGVMTITGGTINANATGVDAIYLLGHTDASGLNVSIGEDVVVNGSTYLTSDPTTKAFTAKITGGTFNGDVWVGTWEDSESSDSYTAIGAISGGTFTPSEDEAAGLSDYLAVGYKFKDDTYTVEKMESQVTVTEDTVVTKDESTTITEEQTTTIVEEIQYNKSVAEKNDADLTYAGVGELKVELKSVAVESSTTDTETVKVTTVTYDVTPLSEGIKVEPQKAITFRLPVPTWFTDANAKVYHEKDLMGVYPVDGSGANRYVEVISESFSEYTLEGTSVEAGSVAAIGETGYITLQAAINAAKNGETVELLSNVTEASVTIEKASGVAFIIDGKNFAFTGGFNLGTGEEVTIQNVNFVASETISLT